MLALSKCRIYCCFCPTPPYANCPLKTNCDTLLLSSALTLQRIAHNGNGWIWNGKRELSIVEPRMCVFATVNENPLKIASSCIRVKLSVCHTFCHWYSDAYASKQLSPRAVLLHSLSAFSSVLCPSSPPSWVLCAPTWYIYSSLRHPIPIITSCVSIITIHPTPSRLACQTSSILCGIEILDEIAPSNCKCTH